MNSKIILCKGIKLDRNYVNVLSFNEEEMLNLCLEKKIAVAENYSFIERNKKLRVAFSYSDCVVADYIAFQNPDYSNKWFFAFIENVEFKGNLNTEISFKIDSWATWYSDWTKKPCLVVREHTNDDSIGANTYPEGLEHGSYIIDSIEKVTELEDMSYIIQCTEWATSEDKPLATNYGGVYSAGRGLHLFNYS